MLILISHLNHLIPRGRRVRRRWRRLEHGNLGMVGYLQSKACGRIRLLLLVVDLLRDDDLRLNGMRNP